jgi:hypothetical protein
LTSIARVLLNRSVRWRSLGGKSVEETDGMLRFLRKVRGLVGLAVTGGVLGALFGTAMAFVFTAVMGFSGLSPGIVLGFAMNWAGFGAISAAGVGLALATLESGKRVEQLSPLRAAMAGAVVGLLIPSAFTAAVAGGVTLSAGLLLVTISTVMLGSAVGAGLVVVARRASLSVAEPSHPTLASAGVSPSE